MCCMFDYERTLQPLEVSLLCIIQWLFIDHQLASFKKHILLKYTLHSVTYNQPSITCSLHITTSLIILIVVQLCDTETGVSHFAQQSLDVESCLASTNITATHLTPLHTNRYPDWAHTLSFALYIHSFKLFKSHWNCIYNLSRCIKLFCNNGYYLYSVYSSGYLQFNIL